MKKVGIAARLLAVAAILSLAAFAVAGCGSDDKKETGNAGSTSGGTAAAGSLESGDKVGDSEKVVVGKGANFDAQQQEIVERIGEFGDATADQDYKKLCNDMLSKSASKIGGDCEKTFSQSGAQLKDFEITVKSVKVDKNGKEATAVVDVTSNVNKAVQSQNLSLIKEGGEWRIQILGQ